MSLFDPDPHELALLMFDGTWVSGEALPELPLSAKEELELQLRRIGVDLLRSADRQEGWDKAYKAIAECLERNGAKLSARQTQLDLPNMVFNFGLKHDWFPNLIRIAKTGDTPGVTCPNRVAFDTYAVRPDHRGFITTTKLRCIQWFKDRIRPVVLEWTLKAEAYHHIALSAASDTEGRKLRRAQLLNDYRERVLDDNGKPHAKYALYNRPKAHIKQHSMHKPEFLKWEAGTLPDEHPATISFERFLSGNERPIRRTGR